jgi:hypothetical protein
MAERYTSLMALVLDTYVEDVGKVTAEVRSRGGIDRHREVGDPTEAQQVHWGGRMQPAVVRSVEGADGAPLLRVEAYIGGDGLRQGLRRQARLVHSFGEAVGPAVRAVRDLSAGSDHPPGWLERIVGGDVRTEDAIALHAEGAGTLWVHTHGAARLDIPDLELYGVRQHQVEAAREALRRVHDQLLSGGMRAELDLPDGTHVYLVPVMRAWQSLPLDWPGIGRAGKERPGHAGPRATLSVLHRRRFGRYRVDLEGVIDRLPAEGWG